jgi:hypothetical protein
MAASALEEQDYYQLLDLQREATDAQIKAGCVGGTAHRGSGRNQQQ